MTIINTETMEENPNMIYDDDHIINGMDKIMKFITHQSKVIQELKKQNAALLINEIIREERLQELTLENRDLKDEIDGSG